MIYYLPEKLQWQLEQQPMNEAFMYSLLEMVGFFKTVMLFFRGCISWISPSTQAVGMPVANEGLVRDSGAKKR